MTNEAPPGFVLLPSTNPFIERAGKFFIRENEDGSRTVGTWIGHEQSNTEGYAHGGFLMAFLDFAITIATMGITLNLSADFLRPAKVGAWIEARIHVRKKSSSLIFADTIVTSGESALMRASGLFRPFEKRP